MKQLLTLERERIGGGDGFLSAAQTQAKARGETIEPPKKKKKENPVGKPKIKKPGPIRSGLSTPAIDEESVSGTATPFEVPIPDGKEIITCELGWVACVGRLLMRRSYACCAAVTLAA